jgi:hypothetical protein
MRRHCMMILLVAFLVTVMWPDAARATDASSMDAAGGYAFSHFTDGSLRNYPTGWFASFGGNITPIFGVVGDASGIYTSDSQQTSIGAAPAVVDLRRRVYTFMAGPKFTSRLSRTNIFGQMLLGSATLSGDATASPVDRSRVLMSGSRVASHRGFRGRPDSR